MLGRFQHCPPYGSEIANVHADRVSFDLRGQLGGQLGALDIGEGDPRSLNGKGSNDGEADPGSTASHQGRLALKSEVHLSSPDRSSRPGRVALSGPQCGLSRPLRALPSRVTLDSGASARS